MLHQSFNARLSSPLFPIIPLLSDSHTLALALIPLFSRSPSHSLLFFSGDGRILYNANAYLNLFKIDKHVIIPHIQGGVKDIYITTTHILNLKFSRRTYCWHTHSTPLMYAYKWEADVSRNGVDVTFFFLFDQSALMQMRQCERESEWAEIIKWPTYTHSLSFSKQAVIHLPTSCVPLLQSTTPPPI